MSAELPDYEWLAENFKSKSAAIRYLYTEKIQDIKVIAEHLRITYRHVFGVVSKLKKVPANPNVCPVCKNRRG